MSSETKCCQNSQWGHVVDVLKRFGALRKPPEAMLDAPGRSRTGYPRATEVLESWKWLWKRWTKAPFIGVSNGKHFLKDVLYEKTTFDVPTKSDLLILAKDLLTLAQKSTFESNLLQNAHGCDILVGLWKRLEAFESALTRSWKAQESFLESFGGFLKLQKLCFR